MSSMNAFRRSLWARPACSSCQAFVTLRCTTDPTLARHSPPATNATAHAAIAIHGGSSGGTMPRPLR